MKKNILFGALAFFAFSAMSIQSVEAQNPVKKQNSTTSEAKKVKADNDKKSATFSSSKQSMKAEKASDDCCASASDNACKNKVSTSTDANKKVRDKAKPSAKKTKRRAARVKTSNK